MVVAVGGVSRPHVGMYVRTLLGEAEVRQADVAPRVEQDVLGLEVPVVVVAYFGVVCVGVS